MAHPMHEHRQHKVEKSRVGHITKHYAKGGPVKKGVLHKALTAHRAEHEAMGIEGEHAKHRMDRPRRASGGKVKKPTTVVNVITGGDQQRPPMPPTPPVMSPAAAAPPPMPPPGASPPPGGLAGAGAGMPGAPPMRARGGSVKGIGVSGVNVGTKVQHDNAKAIEKGKNMHRPRVVTFATGGGVVSFKATGGPVRKNNTGITHSAKPAKETKLPGGAGGGLGRLKKAREY